MAVARTAASTRRPPSRKRSAGAPRRGPGLFATLICLIAIVALVALGAWQLQRRVWKEALLERIAALQSAPPEPLSVVLNRLPGGGAVDFVRVQATCDDLGARALHLYGLRTAGPGWRQITVCRIARTAPVLAGVASGYRSVLVDLGFENEPTDITGRVEAVTLPRTRASIVGVLRSPEPPPWYVAMLGAAQSPAPPGQPSASQVGLWTRRDLPAMAASLGAPAPAPFMLTLESPRAGPRLIPSPLPTDVPNRHLEYAVTWFGLATVLAVFWLASWRRPRTPARRR